MIEVAKALKAMSSFREEKRRARREYGNDGFTATDLMKTILILKKLE